MVIYIYNYRKHMKIGVKRSFFFFFMRAEEIAKDPTRNCMETSYTKLSCRLGVD